MPCFSPLRAYIGEGAGGKKRVRFSPGIGLMPGELPCGNCIGCRVHRSKEWAMRICHEASLHAFNWFLTLTYDDEHLPHGHSLELGDLQRFFKRLRKAKGPVRFFACGEYGETTWRPHYHAIVFGLALEDLREHKTSATGERLYTSASLTKLWGHGHVYVGTVTNASAAYVARYVTKKINGPPAEKHYEWVDRKTGEVHKRRPEFAVMSRRPGVGAMWIDRFQGDVYPSDEVVLDGAVRGKPPRYYDKRVADRDPLLVEQMKARRKAFAEDPKQQANSTSARRRVRAEVLSARLAINKREPI